jgi:hypothetical protein
MMGRFGTLSKETCWVTDGVHCPRRTVEQSMQVRRVDTKSHPTGVRGTIVALNPGNLGGAKGSREMDAA